MALVCYFQRYVRKGNAGKGNAAHAQLLEKLRPTSLAETCRFLTIQSLEFQEFRNHVNDLSQKIQILT